MATTADYLTQLQTDKQVLVDNLVAKGIEATSDETFTTLAPKVADIQAGGDISEYINPEIYYSQYIGTSCIKKLPKIVYTGTPAPRYIFSYLYNITSMPEIEFTYAKSFDGSYMFSLCSNLTDISNLAKISIPITTVYHMFDRCSSLEDVTPFNSLDTSKLKSLEYMFFDCPRLKTITLDFDSSNVTSIYHFMYELRNLTTINITDKFDCGKINNCYYWASNLNSLTTINGSFKNLGKGFTQKTKNYSNYTFSLKDLTNLTHDSLMNIINGLYDLNLTYDVANGGTLYTQQLILGSTNLAKLTEEEIAIATNKGWTVS